jgi:methyl coenzyme M reductase subunit C-like uncharacterized protein (methanogenesis marker protein 7)
MEGGSIVDTLQKNLIKQMTRSGITVTSDGLLRDFVGRGNYAGAIGAIPQAIKKREDELVFLDYLKEVLTDHINEQQPTVAIADH